MSRPSRFTNRRTNKWWIQILRDFSRWLKKIWRSKLDHKLLYGTQVWWKCGNMFWTYLSHWESIVNIIRIYNRLLYLIAIFMTMQLNTFSRSLSNRIKEISIIWICHKIIWLNPLWKRYVHFWSILVSHQGLNTWS